MTAFDAVLTEAVSSGASDIYFLEGVPPAVKVDGTPLKSGHIALQAETAPTDFRKVELLNLEGCTDPKARNYKTYFVKSNASMCRY